jgi:hypothetical protein
MEGGGGVVAHGRRLQTVMLLLQAVEKKAFVLPFSFVLLLLFCCVSFPLLFGFRWCFFPRPDLVQSLGLLVVPFGSGSPFLYSLPLFFFFLSILLGAGVGSLFIGPRERGLFIVVQGERGSAGLASQWAWLARCGAPDFSSSRLGVSRLLQGTRLTGIYEERGRKLSTFPCCTFRERRKKNSVTQNDIVLPFFFT